MAFKTPAYPSLCTKDSWNKKKGLLAKAAGETGVGAAADKAEGSFKKVDWTVFDVDAKVPLGTGKDVLTKIEAIRDDYMKEYTGPVKSLINDLLELNEKATTAAATFKKSKTITKDSTAAAEAVAKAAKDFAASLVLNGSVMSPVTKTWEAHHKGMITANKTLVDNMANTKTYLSNLLVGLGKLKANPAVDTWNKEVKQAGRSVSNNLKGNPELNKKYLKIWVDKFKGFDPVALDFSTLQGEELAAAFNKITAQVAAEARVLKADLG